ncbi:hypothetical protein L292_2219 [Acinetobacter junii CIP 107470 = MTCC 11364]|uniref:Uncharacterized protein n=1 Tax=Acinetobacter junii CIP 107470 = MTCC 11364 TaxID=1217666 RepID=S7WU90_ACIJU|nr:hypothetical protein L292_2219 [Acinetobacter junii CIP 107470 = MTCC 11364]
MVLFLFSCIKTIKNKGFIFFMLYIYLDRRIQAASATV